MKLILSLIVVLSSIQAFADEADIGRTRCVNIGKYRQKAKIDCAAGDDEACDFNTICSKKSEDITEEEAIKAFQYTEKNK